MGKVLMNGEMGENTLEVIIMTKKKDLESTVGLMVESMKDFGRMENNMEKGNISYRIKLLNGGFGIMEIENCGLKIKKNRILMVFRSKYYDF